jgi:hypothetical protein
VTARSKRTDRPANTGRKTLRCAIYTRKSSDEGLDQSFNSLDAQRLDVLQVSYRIDLRFCRNSSISGCADAGCRRSDAGAAVGATAGRGPNDSQPRQNVPLPTSVRRVGNSREGAIKGCQVR